jgi:hypothetical protein
MRQEDRRMSMFKRVRLDQRQEHKRRQQLQRYLDRMKSLDNIVLPTVFRYVKYIGI